MKRLPDVLLYNCLLYTSGLQSRYEDIQVLLEMGYEENDPAVLPEIEEAMDEFSTTCLLYTSRCV